MRTLRLLAGALLATGCANLGGGNAGPRIVVSGSASWTEQFAAREVRRYVYLRTGAWLPVTADAGASGDRIALGVDPALPAQAHRVETTRAGADRVVRLAGGSPPAVLHAAYRFAEHLGVRFDLHGDVIPGHRIALALPDLHETNAPLFDIRGINPFHDFPEGPDWWQEDDYLVYITQLARLRMNFIGLHCYPEGGVGPEPLIWIGRPGEFDTATGRVRASYPSRWATTLGGAWGYDPMKTADYAAGASRLFAADWYGPEILREAPFKELTPEASNGVFDRAGALLHRAFTHARRVGVKTCVGTETPLTVPKPVAERIRAEGKDPADSAVRQEVYRAMFARIAAAHPLDYYWLWTPEDWTWRENKPEQFASTVADIRAALGALDSLGKPFTLATCGWVLGPAHDRSALHAVLPPDSPMSCINRQVGHDPVEPAFEKIRGRPAWAIPWMENDPNMVGPQPWAGRMRADAADARAYGCTGLIGIHWRTAALSPNVNALAQAAWTQPWPRDGGAGESFGALGGQTASFTAPVEGTDRDPVYQVVRYNVDGYRLQVPNGVYRVNLMFNEPAYGEAGKRRFGVRIQGRPLVDKLDLFARVGKNRALDLAMDDVRVTDGRLVVDFVRDIEFPCIAGIEIEGTRDAANQFPAGPYARRINCGGPAGNGFEADDRTSGSRRDRAAPVDDFYLDWCRVRFGEAVAADAARLFARIDGTAFPEISGWLAGPGGLPAVAAPWSEESKRFGFLADFEALRPRIEGAAERRRFDYWLETFRFARAAREVGCARGELDRRAERLKKAPEAERKALAAEMVKLRVGMARLWERMLTHVIATVETPGELGTIANLEQHTRRHLKFLTAHDDAIRHALGASLPAEAEPSPTYAGPDRIVVPTARDWAEPGETLRVPVIVLSTSDVRAVRLVLRDPARPAATRVIPAAPQGRGVFAADLKIDGDLEYYAEAELAGGQVLRWPATAPKIVHVVLAVPAGVAARPP